MHRYLFALTALALFTMTLGAGGNRSPLPQSTLSFTQHGPSLPQSTLVVTTNLDPFVDHVAAEPVKAPAKTKKKMTDCSCSPACTCGCQDGLPCRCSQISVEPVLVESGSVKPDALSGPHLGHQVLFPSLHAPVGLPVLPAQPAFVPSYQPSYAPSYSSGASFGGGRSRGGSC